jgi:predicted amidohydrolase YtcJ
LNRRDFLLLASALSGRAALAQGPRGNDLAILNARILTLEPAKPEAEAVLVRNGRIAAVGTTSEIRAQAGNARVFDAGGRTVTPGLVDAHCHFEMACNAVEHQVACHTPPHKSLEEIKTTLRTKVATTPAGKWIVGRSSFTLRTAVEEKRLFTRQELDEISMVHPIVVFAGLHVPTFNTLGFQETGLWEGPPPRGAFLHRDAAGVPTGVVTEGWTLLPPYSVDEIRAAVKAHTKELFLSKGITSISNLPYSANDLRADQELQAAGELPIRLRVYYHVPHMMSLDAIVAMGLLPGAGDDRFSFGGVKIFIDGTGHDGLGNPIEDLKFSQAELDEFVEKAHRARIQLAMHCLSESGPSMGMTAVERALEKDPTPMRHRLEHASRLQDVEGFRRLKKLGMKVTLLPPTARGQAARRPARYRTLVQEGAEPICVTDATGTTPIFSPWVSMAGIVASPGEGGGVAPEETVSFEDALRMWTIWPARGGFEEKDKGSIAVGKLGDFAVLSDDPRALPGGALFDVQVDATIIGGDVVFERSS